MNFEQYTYENILSSILSRITDPTIDIREGSPIWYAIAPVAKELAETYLSLEAVHKESFAGTASREGLYNALRDIGIDTAEFDATHAVYQGAFNTQITIGSRWAKSGFNFSVTSEIGKDSESGNYKYALTCETAGSQANTLSGNLTPITDYGNGNISTAKLETIISPGRDEISDEDVRTAYFTYVRDKSEGGNLAQYKMWLNQYAGVGKAKVKPCWNGTTTAANHVYVAILNEQGGSAGAELVSEVQEYLDPNKEGLGNGKAPIGAVVIVESGTPLSIDIQATVTGSSSHSDVEDAIANYFKSIAFDKSEVNYFALSSVILNCESVTTMSDLKLRKHGDSNWVTSSISLSEFQYPVKGDTTWN